MVCYEHIFQMILKKYCALKTAYLFFICIDLKIHKINAFFLKKYSYSFLYLYLNLVCLIYFFPFSTNISNFTFSVLLGPARISRDKAALEVTALVTSIWKGSSIFAWKVPRGVAVDVTACCNFSDIFN